jgi:hypothetical protein
VLFGPGIAGFAFSPYAKWEFRGAERPFIVLLRPGNAVAFDVTSIAGAEGEAAKAAAEEIAENPRQAVTAAAATAAKVESTAAGAVGAAEVGVQGEAVTVQQLSPSSIRFSQHTAGGRGRATVLRQSMSESGWAGPPVDAVATPDGVVTIDNTRVAIARELGLSQIPVTVHAPEEFLPASMVGRFGEAKTWGEALAHRTASQRPPLPATGTIESPRLPK